MSCCLIDLDGFKRVNDHHGPPFAGRLLAEVAGTLGEGVRIGDAIGRYGGAQFLVLLPDTDQTAAAALAERLRSMISAMTLTDASVRLNASVAVAHWRPDWTAHELLAAAGAALLEAKWAGGALVVTAGYVRAVGDRDVAVSGKGGTMANAHRVAHSSEVRIAGALAGAARRR